MSDKGVGIEAGTVLNGRYKVVRRLGEGAFGRVYLAEDQQESGVLVAVKELAIGHLSNAEEKRDATAWFKREVSLLLTLEHPGVANIHGHWSSSRGSGHMYLVMDYIPGKSLADLLPSEPGGLATPRVVRWGITLCDVLQYLHSRTPPMVFRDLKPSNIIINSRTDTPVLIDFGLARQFAPAGGTAVGTWGYVPFEQAMGKAEPRSDLYALGAVLHALLSGRQPDFEYRNLWRSGMGLEAALMALFPPLATLAPGTPELLSHVVTCATSFQAEHRFPSAAAMAAALRKVQAVIGLLEEPVSGLQVGTAPNAPRPQPAILVRQSPQPAPTVVESPATTLPANGSAPPLVHPGESVGAAPSQESSAAAGKITAHESSVSPSHPDSLDSASPAPPDGQDGTAVAVMEGTRVPAKSEEPDDPRPDIPHDSDATTLLPSSFRHKHPPSGRIRIESSRLSGSGRLRSQANPLHTETLITAAVPPLVVPAEALGLQARIGIKRPVKSDPDKSAPAKSDATESLPGTDALEEQVSPDSAGTEAEERADAWSDLEKQPVLDLSTSEIDLLTPVVDLSPPVFDSPVPVPAIEPATAASEQPGRQLIAAVGASGLLRTDTPLPLDSLDTLPQMQPLEDPTPFTIVADSAPRETLESLIGDLYIPQTPSEESDEIQTLQTPGGKRGIWPFRKAREREVAPVQVAPVPSTPPARIALTPSLLKVDAAGTADYQSISEALQVAQPGAVIEVMPGLYNEDLIIDQPVEIVGIGRPDQIVIDAVSSSCVMMRAPGAILRNVTLRSNLQEGQSHFYTVNVTMGRLLLEDCIVITTSALACIAVHGVGASPIIRRCTLRNPIERALAVYDHAQAHVEQCDILGATVPVRISSGASTSLHLNLIHGGRFGGVWVMDHASARITECDIVDNGHHGVAIKQGSSAALSHCRINRNGWSAVSVADSSNAHIEHCDLSGNKHTAWDIAAPAKKHVLRVGNREA